MNALLCISAMVLVQQPLKGQDLPQSAIARFGSTHFRHSGPASYAALSPEGALLATACSTDGMRLWDVATGKRLLSHPRTSRGSFGAVLFSPDGKLLISRREASLVFWDVAKREARFEIMDKQSSYHAPTFSADGKLLAVYSNDGKTRVWEVGTGKLMAELPTGGLAQTFSADGKTLITDDRKGILRFWDVPMQKTTRQLQLSDHFFLVTLLALSPNNELLAIGEGPHHQNGDRVTPMYFRMHDVATGKERYRIPMKWEDGFVSALAFAPDGKSMVLARQPLVRAENYLEMRDVATGKLLRRVPLPDWNYYVLSFSANGKFLAVAGAEFSVRLWTYPDFKPHLPPVGHIRPLSAIACSADGKHVYSASEDQTLITWDAKTARPLATWPISVYSNDAQNNHDLVATPDGKFLIAAIWTSRDGHSPPGQRDFRFIPRKGKVEFLRIPDGKKIREIGPVSGGVAMSPDGKLVAAGDGVNIRLWNVGSGESRKFTDDHTKEVRRVAFSPDGDLVASTHNDGFLCLWHSTTGQLARRLEFAREDPRDRSFFASSAPTVTFSADGRYVVSSVSRWSTLIEVWEVASGERVQLIRLEKKRSEAPTLYAIGRTLLSCDRYNGLQLFDLANGKLLPTPIGPYGVNAVTFAPDGNTVMTGGNDGLVRLWNKKVFATAAIEKVVLDRNELEKYWQSLRADGKSYFAVHWQLVRGDLSTVRFLAERIRPATGPDHSTVSKRIAELASEDFKTRTLAYIELEKWGKDIEFALQKALASTPSLEARRRIEQLLAASYEMPYSADTRRLLRAIAVLEGIGSQAARDLLEKMAHGAPGARVTVDAKSALQRLQR